MRGRQRSIEGGGGGGVVGVGPLRLWRGRSCAGGGRRDRCGMAWRHGVLAWQKFPRQKINRRNDVRCYCSSEAGSGSAVCVCGMFVGVCAQIVPQNPEMSWRSPLTPVFLRDAAWRPKSPCRCHMHRDQVPVQFRGRPAGPDRHNAESKGTFISDARRRHL